MSDNEQPASPTEEVIEPPVEEPREQPPNPLPELLAEVRRLTGHSYLVNNSTFFRMLMYQLARGLAFGFGSVLGATLLVSIAVYFLSNIDFIPILGDWGAQIADDIIQGRR
ncbi:MAG: DUF5665 domain-containing protein [Planktomarina sp.]